MRIGNLLFLGIVLVACLCSVRGSSEEPGMLDGSFESGTELPQGWSRCAADSKDSAAVWLDGESHGGNRALWGKSAHARAVWKSAPVSIDAGKKYGASGFIKPASGAAWLVVEIRSAGGRRLGNWSSAPVTGPGDWTYLAVETVPVSRAEKDSAATARIEFWVRDGQSALDDAHLFPLVPCEFANRGFEAPLDKKGRIPYWSEEKEIASWTDGKDSTLPEGERAGKAALDTQNPGEGASCLAVTASGGWFPVTSAPYAVWPQWKRIELTATARCEPGAKVQLAIACFDSAQHYLGTQRGLVENPADWKRISSGMLSPPDHAQTFKPMLLVMNDGTGHGRGAGDAAAASDRDAHAWFDAVEARVVEEPCVRVVVNQVGYDISAPKQAVILTNFFPPKIPYAKAWLIDRDGKEVWESKASCAGRMRGQSGADWGWYVWRCDFSGFGQPGQYRIRASAGSGKALSNAFAIGADLLFRETAAINVDFFHIQRCGCAVPGWHAPCHMDDAKLPDGTHRDLIGGWHSAGDYNKLTWEYGDGGVLYALAHAAAAAPQYFALHDRDADGLPDIIDEAEWGAKYLVKLQDPATGGLLNHIEQGPNRQTWMNWCPPEETTDNVAGTEDDPIVTPGEGNSPLAIGGWALLGALHPAMDGRNPHLSNSIRLWEHATAKEPAGSPLLLLSGIDLFQITKEDRYLDYCRHAVETLLAAGKPDGSLAGGYGNTGDIPAAALSQFALAFPDDPKSAAIKARLAEHLTPFLAEAANPLGLMMQQPGPQGWFFDPSSAMGCNYQLCSRAWSATMVYRVTRDARALRYAMDQLDFLLGRNPYDVCMMEGRGSVNLPRYHHRYITIPGHERGAVPGAIPNGCVRDIAGWDRPGLDLSTGGRPNPSYRTNEPWLVHNVFYMMAITALHEAVAK